MNIDNIEWQPCGSDEDPTSRLIAKLDTLSILGVPMHVEAYALRPDYDVQEFADRYFSNDDEAFFQITGGAVETTFINGREYALIATPHGV